MEARRDANGTIPFFWGLVVATVAYIIFHFALQMSLPADGCRTGINHISPEGITCTDLLRGQAQELRLNDLVIKMGQRTVEEWLGWWGPRPNWPPGTTVPYTILRQGKEEVVGVTLQPLPLWPVMRPGVLYYVFSLTFFLLGCFVFWHRPEDPAARVFLVICLAVALQRCGEVLSFQPSLIVRGWPFWLYLSMDQLSWWLMLSAGLHFTLIFPMKKNILARHATPVLGLVYGAFPAVGIGALALGPAMSQGLFRLYRANHLSALAGGLVALGLFLHSFRTTRQPLARAQLRWLAWALGVSLLPALALYSLPAILNTRRLLPEELILMLFLLIPLSMAFSIVRYRLWDIDVIIRRSLVYGALTALLTGLYVVLVTVLQRLSQALTGQTSTLALALSTLVIALFLQPARTRVQLLVDRLFFRRQYEARQMLVSFTQALSFLQGTREVLGLVLDAVIAAMDVEAASAMVLDEASGEYRIAEARNLSQQVVGVKFRRGQGAAGWVEREGKPLLIQPAEPRGEGLMTAALALAGEELNSIQAVVCIPLLVGEKAIGLVNLGEKRSQEPYSRDDMEILVTMGRSAALALENAKLHEERMAILRQQLAQVTAAQEEERRRIARELHDGVGPVLASLNLRLRTARKLLERDQLTAGEIEELAEQAQVSIQDIRRLIYNLRPAALDELGLVPALREYVARYREEQDLEVVLSLPETQERLPAPLETALFRIVQEALTNVARHAWARRVEVAMTRDERGVTLCIADDGRGFDPQAPRAGTHLGLWSMRERVEQLGGRLEVASAPGEGTTVKAVIPLMMRREKSSRGL